ncbi:hypothetical protein [Pseudalkalibacillus berkeleyi]|uniref:Uncharacterized protein n=1 Tax=Pseudalkalibacillus berkeleyi TaxID=1069813 RepID=A0ABS9H1R7_9BACL|nr:hypothetical protein [Pseudalkalibacillus berkeleyi]MCF6137778.1 hypothetical protein [Pseudalkalibacillus berkeleyi]
MKNNNKVALLVSIIVLVGIPILFLIISISTGKWGYLAWSLPPSFAAGFTGLMITYNQMKKEKNSA